MPNLEIAAADPGTCVHESEIICACTSSPTPLFDGRDLRPGTYLNLVGSGKKQGRRSSEEITIFKSAGCALEDLVAAELLLAAISSGEQT